MYIMFGWGLSSASSGSQRIARPRATLKPMRNPSLSSELNNERVYAILHHIWTHEIANHGPDIESLVGTAIFDVPYRFFELYHVFPTTEPNIGARVTNVMTVVGDMFEFGSTRVILSPGLLVSLEPQTGEMLWSGIASRLSPDQLNIYVRETLATHIGAEAKSIGWNGYK